jgi:hypothetical protein
LMDTKYNHDLLSSLNITIEDPNPGPTFEPHSISNVAVASAITAYARIEMMKYKQQLGEHLFYSDTDSLFSDIPLDPSLIGTDIGQMKDEISGGLIKEAYFFNVKQYAYHLGDPSKNKAVFAGVKRHSLTWEETLRLKNGETVVKAENGRIYRNFKNLSLTKKDIKIEVN